MPRQRLAVTTLALVSSMLLVVVGCTHAPSLTPASRNPRATRLVDSAWPSAWHDAQHTSRSSAVGPEVPVKQRVLPLPSSAVGPGGILYGEDDEGRPTAVDPSDGSTKWRLPDSLGGFSSVPGVLDNGASIFTSVDKGLKSRSYVFAVDDSGHELWRTWLGAGLVDLDGDQVNVSSPTVGADGTIYVSASLFDAKTPTSTVYALDPSTGEIKWTHSVAAASFRAPVLSTGGTIYAPDDRGHTLVALNQDGSKRWSIPARCDSSDPAVGTDGTIYLLVFTDTGSPTRMNLVAINPDGSQKWQFPTDAQGSVAIGPDGTLYVVGEALHAISSGGRPLWSVPVENFASAVVDGAGTVYVCDGDWLLAVNPDGSKKWRFNVGGSGDLRIGSDERVYVGGVVIGPAGG